MRFLTPARTHLNYSPLRPIINDLYALTGNHAAPSQSPSLTSGMMNSFLPDVYIYTDHTKSSGSGVSPGYGVALVASTTSGCVFGSQRSSGRAPGVFGDGALGSLAAQPPPESPEDLGAEAAGLLLDEIARGGCIDTCAQPLAFSLMALSPPDVSRLRVGRLGPAGIATLRLIREFFGVVFHLQPESREATGDGGSAASARADVEAPDELEDADDGVKKKRRRKGAPAIAGSLKRGVAADGDPDSSVSKHTALTKNVAGGTSGRTVLVSCQGVGFRNLAKKVT
jgi:RNA 3'-terminal phosphate cyclase (RTC), insert domain